MIIVNKMFSGSFLENKLGHEAFNLFRSDNGGHYIYINAYGTIRKSAKKSEGVLLVRRLAPHLLEILGYATGLECLMDDGFFNSKEKAKARNKREIEHQKQFIERRN